MKTKHNTLHRFSFFALLSLNSAPLNAMIIPSLVQLATLAVNGDPEAQYELGRRCLRKDCVQAVDLYHKAASKSARAQCDLGVCYARGTGITKDNAQAVYWFQKAANQGIAKAQYNLGVCYLHGIGTTKNIAQAVSWIQKAAEQEFAPAQKILLEGHTKAADQRNIGICYMNGSGITKNAEQGFYLLKKAAEQGDIPAKYYVGICYEHGIGADANAKEATSLYKQYLQKKNPTESCPICLETLIDMQPEQLKQSLTCECENRHIFHKTCLSQWKATSADTATLCPLCRQSLLQ